MTLYNDKSELKDKKIMVVGLARTGVSLVKFLSKQGAQVSVSDHKSKAELVHYLEKIEGLDVELDLGGAHAEKKIPRARPHRFVPWGPPEPEDF